MSSHSWVVFRDLFFSTLQQLGGDPQRWTEVYAILKGTSLSCYHRQEDVEAGVEPAFTIAINKVGTNKARRGRSETQTSLRAHATVSVSGDSRSLDGSTVYRCSF